MKKLKKIRVIEQPRSDSSLTLEEMLLIEGGDVCVGRFVTVEGCSDYLNVCYGTYKEDGVCNPTASPNDRYCDGHIDYGKDD